MNPQTLTAFPLVERLGWTLLHSAWEGLLVLLAAMVVLRLLARSSAQVRYLTSCAALLLVLALAVGTFVALRPEVPIAPQPQIQQAIPMASELPGVEFTLDRDVEPMEVAPLAAEVVAAPTAAQTSWQTAVQRALEPILPWLVVLWAMGSAAMSLWHVGGWIAVQRLKSATHPAAQDLRDRVARLAARLRIRQAVRVAESNLARAPMVIGWFRPVILVPAAVLTGLNPAHLDALLAHELAHIRRYDYLVNLVQVLVESLMFYHPAVWWISRRIRLEREHCCDDIAVTICRRIDYVEALAGVAEINVRGAALAAGGSGQHELLGRIGRLLGVTRPEGRRRSGLLAGALVLAALGGLAVGLISPGRMALAADAATQPSTTQPATEPGEAVANISGTVTWDDGEPIEGVAVDYLDHSKWPALSHWNAVTDGAGRYHIEGVPVAPVDGQLTIESVPGRSHWRLPPTRMVKPIPGATTENFTVHRAVKIAGTLINETNDKPAADHRFFVEFEGGEPDGMQSGFVGSQLRTNDEGAFAASVPSGVPLTIRFPLYNSQEDVSWAAQSPSPRPVPLGKLTADKTDIAVRARLTPYTKFEGKLVDAKGEPIGNAQLVHQTGSIFAIRSQTDATGRFRIRLPSDRTVKLLANARQHSGELAIAPGQTEGTFTLGDKVNIPCVVTRSDGTPARRFVFVYGDRPFMTNEEGKCILVLAPGASQVARWEKEQNRDYAPGETTLDLSTAKDGEPVRFTVQLYDKTLKGRVLDEQGNPIEGAVITAGSQLGFDRSVVDGKHPTTNADGTFTLQSLASGVLNLKISKDGYRTTLFETQTDNADFVAVVAKPEAKVQRRFVVVTPDAKPAADLPMSILVEDQPVRALPVRTDADGAIDLSGLTDRPCTLICDVPGYGITWKKFDADTAGTLRVVAANPSPRAQYVRVLNGPDSPAGEVRVYLLCDEPKSGRQMLASLASARRGTDGIPIPSWKTNEAGYARIDRIASGGLASVAAVRADGSVVSPDLDEDRLWGAYVVEMSVAPAGSINVRLVHPDGRPAELKEGKVAVRLLDNDRNGRYSRGETMTVSAAGEYKFTNQTPGRYGIGVSIPDGRSFGERFELKPGQTANVRVEVPEEALKPFALPEISLKEGVDDDPRWKLPPGDLIFTPGGSDEAAAELVKRVLQVNKPWLLPSAAKGRFSRRMTYRGGGTLPFTTLHEIKSGSMTDRIGSSFYTALHLMAGSPPPAFPGSIRPGTVPGAVRIDGTTAKPPYTVKMVGKTKWNGLDLTAVDVTFEQPVFINDLALDGQISFSSGRHQATVARIVIEESKAVPVLIQSDPVDRAGAKLPGPLVWRFHHQFANVDEGLAPQMLEWSDARPWTNGQDIANEHQRQEFQVVNGVWLFKSGSRWIGDPNYHDRAYRIRHAEILDVEVQAADK